MRRTRRDVRVPAVLVVSAPFGLRQPCISAAFAGHKGKASTDLAEFLYARFEGYLKELGYTTRPAAEALAEAAEWFLANDYAPRPAAAAGARG